jgi:DNA-binding response OmpR family regulator
MIKKLRKFTNMTLVCYTDNQEMMDGIKENLNDCKELIFVDSETIGDLNFDRKVDILLVDFGCKGSVEVLNDIKISKPLLPKIVILEDGNEDNIVACINASAYSILKSPIDYEDLKFSIVMALNQSKRSDKILLKEGIYFDAYRERFYNKSEHIPFTKLEYSLLKLLLDNHDKVIGYDEIKEKVWKGKKMSIFTMRNVINKIRNKTYYKIIRNNSSQGYQIDTLS